MLYYFLDFCKMEPSHQNQQWTNNTHQCPFTFLQNSFIGGSQWTSKSKKIVVFLMESEKRNRHLIPIWNLVLGPLIYIYLPKSADQLPLNSPPCYLKGDSVVLEMTKSCKMIHVYLNSRTSRSCTRYEES